MLGSSALNTERADRKMHDMLTAFLPTSGKQGKNESPPEFAQFKILCDETSRHGYIHEFIERRGTIRFNYSSVVANWILLSFLVDGPPSLVPLFGAMEIGRARVLWLFKQELHNIQKTVFYNNYITAIYTPLDPPPI